MDPETIVRNFIEDIFNRRDLTALDRYLAPNFVDHDRPTMSGRQSLARSLSEFLAIVPDPQINLTDIIRSGDDVAVRITMEGSHEGKRIRIVAIGFFQTNGSRITGHRGFAKVIS